MPTTIAVTKTGHEGVSQDFFLRADSDGREGHDEERGRSEKQRTLERQRRAEMEQHDAEIHRMPDKCVRAIGLERVALEHVHADAVAAPQRPHRPCREDRGGEGDGEAGVAQRVIEVDRQRLDVRDDERQPDEGRVVLDPPRRVGDEEVRALPAQDAQSGGRQENEVRREQHRDAQRTVVHRTILAVV